MIRRPAAVRFRCAPLLVAWALGCAGSPAPPVGAEAAVAAVSSVHGISVPYPIDDVEAISADGGMLLAILVEGEGTRLMYAAALGPDGELESGPTLVVKGFDDLFAAPVAAGDALFVPVWDPVGGPEGAGWAVYSWAASGPPERRLACHLPDTSGGRLLVRGDDLVAVLEGTDGSVRGFHTALDGAACPEAADLAVLLSPPLPEAYRVQWVGDEVAVVSRAGTSYRIRLLDRLLRPQRSFRVGNSAAPPGLDAWVGEAAPLGALALFGQTVDGAWDLYLAPLDQVTAGPLAAARAVATADVEREPSVFPHGPFAVLTWVVWDEHTGARLLIGGPWIDGAPALPGGEVLWRLDPLPAAYGAAWTDHGLVRVETVGPQTLRLSLYRPWFW